MDPQVQVAVFSSIAAVVGSLFVFLGTRHRPGLPVGAEAPPLDPVVVVQKIAHDGIEGMSPAQVAAAMSALAQVLGDQESRIGKLERNGLAYLRRIAVLDYIAVNDQRPPPRSLPPWPDEPRIGD